MGFVFTEFRSCCNKIVSARGRRQRRFLGGACDSIFCCSDHATFHHAPCTFKVHLLITSGASQDKAIEDVDTMDRDRAAFVKPCLKLNWPELCLYNAMFNTEMGAIRPRRNPSRCVHLGTTVQSNGS